VCAVRVKTRSPQRCAGLPPRFRAGRRRDSRERQRSRRTACSIELEQIHQRWPKRRSVDAGRVRRYFGLRSEARRERGGELGRVSIGFAGVGGDAIVPILTRGRSRQLRESSSSCSRRALVKVADGYFVIAVGNDVKWHWLCELIGRAELADVPRFARNRDRAAHRDELSEELEGALRTRATAEMVRAAQGRRRPRWADPDPRRGLRPLALGGGCDETSAGVHLSGAAPDGAPPSAARWRRGW
jgi:hypothetical protein